MNVVVPNPSLVVLVGRTPGWLWKSFPRGSKVSPGSSSDALRRRLARGRLTVLAPDAARLADLRRIAAETRRPIVILTGGGGTVPADAIAVSLPETAIHILPRPVEVPRHGPFDIIGDVHGCLPELEMLLRTLGWKLQKGNWHHPDGRMAVFLGDIADRGDHNIETLRLVTRMVEHGDALYTPGNHCHKLYRYFQGRKVNVSHGLETTAAEFQRLAPHKQEEIRSAFVHMFESAPPYLLLDHGKLAVAHAGLEEWMIGSLNRRVLSFCLFGSPTGRDTEGRPIRRDWAKDYHGDVFIVYGHTPVQEPQWRGNTVNIDQGVAFGGKLTAMRYPEMATVSVPSFGARAMAPPTLLEALDDEEDLPRLAT